MKLQLVDGVPVTYIMLEKKGKNDFLIHIVQLKQLGADEVKFGIVIIIPLGH